MANFATKDEVSKAVSAILSVLRKYKRGDSVEWDEIESAIGSGRYTPLGARVIIRARRDYLRQTGIWVHAPGDNAGLELLTVEQQQTDQMRRRQRKAVRQMRKQYQEVSCMRDEDLNNTQRMIKYAQMESITQARKDFVRKAKGKPTLRATQPQQPRVNPRSVM